MDTLLEKISTLLRQAEVYVARNEGDPDGKNCPNWKEAMTAGPMAGIISTNTATGQSTTSWCSRTTAGNFCDTSPGWSRAWSRR